MFAVVAFVMGVVVHRTRRTWKGIIYRVCGVGFVGRYDKDSSQVRDINKS